MVEFLVASVQALCMFGLLCGAYFSIAYGPQTVKVAPAERFDPVTSHSWNVGIRRLRDARGSTKRGGPRDARRDRAPRRLARRRRRLALSLHFGRAPGPRSLAFPDREGVDGFDALADGQHHQRIHVELCELAFQMHREV